ncbi:hypothetical protein PFLG_01265 [Plasmodium falciparum RAJ116]|uniref:WD repeat-containing protein n=1 Tax=Plasmodium falciparum RAJ116 TaxID=580058 RepID=A0A0L0CW37_PLAFA|nr:hypothetical protein PFLG_01265 [Plasmodium falciparum RAJ116]
MENSIPYNLYIKKRNIFSLEENHNLNLNSLKNNDTYQVKLRHKYVHGYLSEKNNILKFLQNKFIYPIKNLIVIYDLINRDQFIFSHHTNQVFLIRCREKNRTVVSAEEEKRKIKIFVWNKLTLEILSEIKIKKENFIDIDYLNDKNIILLCKYNDKLILCIISLIYKNKEIRLNKKCVSVIKSLNDFYIHVKTEKTKGKDHEDEYFGKCKTGFLIEKNDLSKEKGSIYCIKNIKNINKRYVKQNRMIYSRLNEIMKKKKKKRRRKKKLVTNIPLCNNNFSYCKENQERFILIDTLKKKKLFKKSILKKIKNQKDLMNMIHIKSKKHQLINFSSYYIKFIKPLFNKNKYYNKSLYKNMKIVVDINENVCIYNDHYIFVYIIKDYNIYERLKYKNFKCSLFSSDHMFYLRKENFYFFYTFYFELFINSYLYNRYVCLKKYNDKCKIKKNEENYEQADEDEEKKFVHYKIGGNYFINDEADHMKKTKILIDSNEYNKNYVNIFNSTFVYKNYMDVECTNTFLHNNNNNKYDNNCNNNNKYDNNCNNNKYDYYYSSEQYYKFPPLVNIQINVVEIFNFVCTENSDDINVIFKIKDEYGKKRRAHTNRINTEQQKKRDSNKIIKRRNNRNHQINTPNQLSNNMIIKKKKKKKKNLIMKKYLVIGTKNGMIIINDFLKPHKIIHLEKICNEPIVSIFIFQNDMLILNRSGIIFFMDIHNFVIYRDIDIFFSLEHKTKNLSYENCNNNIKRNCTYNSEETTQFINGKKICNGKKMCDGKKIRDDDETFEDSTNLAYHHSNNLPCDTFEGKRIVNRMCNKKYNYDYKESYRTFKKRYINSFCHLNMYTILIGTTYNEIIIYNLLCDELCYIYDKNNKKISSYNIHNNNIIYSIENCLQSFEDTYYKQNNLMNVNNTSHVIKRNEYIGGKQKIYKNNKNNESTVNTSCDDYLGSTNQVKNTFPFNHNNNNKKKNKEKKTNIIHGKRNEQMDNSFNKFLSLIHTNNNSKAHVSNKSKKYDKIKIVKHIPQVVKSFKRRTNMCKMDNRKKDISLLSIIKNKEEKKKIHDIHINGESYNVVSKGVSIPVMLKNKLLNVRYEKEHLKKKNEEKEDCSKDEFLKKMKIIKKKKNNNNNKINNHYVTYKLLKSMLKRKKNIYLCESKKLNCKHDDDIIKKDTSFIRRGINNESYIRDDIYLGINEKNEIQRKNFKPNIEVNKEIIEIEQFCNRGGDLCVINNGEINNLSYCINKETKLRTKGLGYIQNYLKKYMNTDIKMKGEFRDNINRSSNSIKHINSNLYKISPQNSDTTNYMGEKDKFINSYHVNNYVHSMMIRLPQRESVTYIEKKKKNKIDITKYNAYTKLIKKGEGDKKKNLI